MRAAYNDLNDVYSSLDTLAARIASSGINPDWNATTGLASILNKPSLAPVALSGAFADLSGRPILAPVATSGLYSDISGKPTIPAAQVSSDWSASSGIAQILNKPTISTTLYQLANGATNNAYTAAEESRLTGMATGATANSSDA